MTNSLTVANNERSTEHLIHLILTRNEKVPNFSIMLGSGASSISGVQTADQMIREWRRILFHRFGSGNDYQDWLNSQEWYKHEDEYSLLFETVFDQPSQRRNFIEECVKRAQPSWGYVYLTSLIESRHFDGVFTTNFDDLVNEACYIYSERLRPIVAAHDSAIQGIRVTSMRAKIIKLHGDFLYDNIKNTLAELETLEDNTKRKLKQFAQEYGLVVVGYSGRDRSVMDTLELLLRDDENYKQGVYWCRHRGSEVSARLKALLRRDRVYLVETDGFDEFMAELHRAAKLQLPKALSQPLVMARDRTRLLTDVSGDVNEHAVIDSHRKDVLRALETPTIELPLPVSAAILRSSGDLDQAISLLDKAHRADPEDSYIVRQYAEMLADAGKKDDLATLVGDSDLPGSEKTYLLLRAEQNELVVEVANRELDKVFEALDSSDYEPGITRLNRAIALKRLGRRDEMMADITFLEESGVTVEDNVRAGVAALKGDRESMLEAIRDALGQSISPHSLRVFPVFEDYRDDPEFKGLSES